MVYFLKNETNKIGENICKPHVWGGVNVQKYTRGANIQNLQLHDNKQTNKQKMGKGPEETFFSRKTYNGQQVYAWNISLQN